MADQSFDAIIIGGGTKALITAMYLAKYGGMEVAIFERRHELGGGWSSEESAAPGFITNTHAVNINKYWNSTKQTNYFNRCYKSKCRRNDFVSRLDI